MTITPEEKLLSQVMAEHPKHKPYRDGLEYVSSVPLEPPLGFVKRPSLTEQIRNMVRSEQLAQAAAASGLETFEESEDFDVDDDYDPTSPYEMDFDPQIPSARTFAEELPLAAAVAPAPAASPLSAGIPPEGVPPAPKSVA